MSLLDRTDLTGKLFFPRDDTATTPRGAVDHLVPVDGATLHLRVHEPRASPTARGKLVLLFHGNGEIVSDWDRAAPSFTALGWRFAVVDYRGYGRSTGAPTMRRLLEDAHAVVAHARALTDGALVIMGRSLGSAAAWEVAADAGLAGLIIDSGFTDVQAFAARRGVAPSALTEEELALLDPIPKIARAELPMLLLHGERDAVIRLHEAERAHAASPSSEVELVPLPGRGHNDLSLDAAYWPAVRAFLSRR